MSKEISRDSMVVTFEINGVIIRIPTSLVLGGLGLHNDVVTKLAATVRKLGGDQASIFCPWDGRYAADISRDSRGMTAVYVARRYWIPLGSFGVWSDSERD